MKCRLNFEIDCTEDELVRLIADASILAAKLERFPTMESRFSDENPPEVEKP